MGPKIALALLSGISVAASSSACRRGHGALTRVPGIGRKTAERLIVEMRDRLSTRGLAGEAPGAGGEPRERGLGGARRARLQPAGGDTLAQGRQVPR